LNIKTITRTTKRNKNNKAYKKNRTIRSYPIEFSNDNVNPQRVIHEKGGGKEENKKNTYASTSQNIHLNILYIYFIYLFNCNKTAFYKNSYFNTLLVILILSIKTVDNII
jgi:hypothetical protein